MTLLSRSEADRAADDDESLWIAWRSDGSTTAREILFMRYAVFARNIALRYFRKRTRGDLDLGDLQQLAYAGLLQALDRYDPMKGGSFPGFAAFRIKGSIIDGLTKMNEVREQLSWKHRMRRERMESLRPAGDDAIGLGEAMDALTDLAVGLAIGFMLEGTGLYAPGDGEGTQASKTRTGYETAEWQEMLDALTAEIAALPPRERAILHHHYIEGVGFDHLAALLDLSKGRISQLHRGALGSLRKRMAARGHFRLER